MRRRLAGRKAVAGDWRKASARGIADPGRNEIAAAAAAVVVGVFAEVLNMKLNNCLFQREGVHVD